MQQFVETGFNTPFKVPDSWKNDQRAEIDEFPQENLEDIQHSHHSVRRIKELDPRLVMEIIKSSPLKLQKIIRNLKNRNSNKDAQRRFVPKSIMLLGEPGVGKSTLAQAIALHCDSR